MQNFVQNAVRNKQHKVTIAMRNRTFVIIFSALLGYISLAAGSNAFALGPGHVYQVELIVFSHFTSQAVDAEQWPWARGRYVKPKAAIELSPLADNATKKAPFYLLPKKDFRLKREARALARQRGYKILLHIAWRQQISGPRNTKAVHIYGGNNFNSKGRVIFSDTVGNSPYQANGQWQINGTIKLSRKRYFDLHLNLYFATPSRILKRYAKNHYFKGVSGLAYFHLAQNRRMKSRELNYIGYPFYGVLIKVIPIST